VLVSLESQLQKSWYVDNRLVCHLRAGEFPHVIQPIVDGLLVSSWVETEDDIGEEHLAPRFEQVMESAKGDLLPEI